MKISMPTNNITILKELKDGDIFIFTADRMQDKPIVFMKIADFPYKSGSVTFVNLYDGKTFTAIENNEPFYEDVIRYSNVEITLG